MKQCKTYDATHEYCQLLHMNTVHVAEHCPPHPSTYLKRCLSVASL